MEFGQVILTLKLKLQQGGFRLVLTSENVSLSKVRHSETGYMYLPKDGALVQLELRNCKPLMLWLVLNSESDFFLGARNSKDM